MATTSPPTSPKPSRRPDGANFFRPYGTCTSVELFPALKRRSTLARPYGTAKKKIHYKRKPVSGLRAFPFIHATNMGSRKLAGTARFVEATSGRLSDAAGSRIYGTSKAATFFNFCGFFLQLWQLFYRTWNFFQSCQIQKFPPLIAHPNQTFRQNSFAAATS